MSPITGRAVVVGGSIGGLTAALLLRDAGWEVDVFERSATLLEGRGAGIVLHPATIRYLVERAGVSPAEISVSASWFRYLDRAGRVAHEEECRYRFTSYNSLYRRLLDRLDRSRYHLGQECVGVDAAGDSPSVTFASGRVVRSDLIVCADGINSVGRRLLAPGAQPRYADYVAWRGTVGEEQLAPAAFEALSNAITYHVLADGHILSYPIPGQEGSVETVRRLANWLWYRNVRTGSELDDLLTGKNGVRFGTSVPPGLVPDERIRELDRDASASLPPAMAEMVAQTPDPFIQVIFDVEVEQMAFGRVCLIGDSAFTARPHIGAGTAKAAEDAWTLAAAAGDCSGDLDAALAAWSRRQLELGEAAIARSRDAGTRLQSGRWRVGEPLPFGLYRAGDSSMGDA